MRYFSAVIHMEEDMYVAKCPEIGTVSQGRTADESMKNIKEVTGLYIEELPIDGILKEECMSEEEFSEFT